MRARGPENFSLLRHARDQAGRNDTRAIITEWSNGGGDKVS